MRPLQNTIAVLVFLCAAIVQGEAAEGSSTATAATVTVFEFYNTTLKHYFRTAVVAEANAIDAGAAGPGWQRTNLNFTASDPGSGAGNDVCRFYNPVANTHFYTADPDECVQVKLPNSGWRYEELSFRIQLPVGGICPQGTKPVYRTYNDRFAFNDSNHRLMTTLATYSDMIAQGWRGEGIVMCAVNDGALADVTATANSTIGGTVNVRNLTIPAGVTVTVSAELALNATGLVTIAGTLTGDCKPIAIVASGKLDVSGPVSNPCASASDSAPLALVGYGGYRFTAPATVSSSGDMLVTNSASLPRSVAAIPGEPSISEIVGKALAVEYDCESNGGVFFKGPASAANGLDGGPTGDPGKDGARRTLGCSGNGLLVNSSVFGQNGGNGGRGTDARAANVEAKGGAGGKGGELFVRVTGQLDFAGTNVLNSGGGGDGGPASATARPVANADGPSAVANGGRGGNSGLITVHGGGGITVTGSLAFNVGQGGQGGDATATGAAGADSTAGSAAGRGGAGTATGGGGGQSPNLQLTSAGNIPGLANVSVTGGNGGKSGKGDATGGKGGDGKVLPNKDAGDGGAVTARSGIGGDAGVRNLAGALVGTGGASADAVLQGAMGGQGYNDCTVPISEGGKGGNGGTASGGAARAGTGAANGPVGVTREVTVSNGGNGGHGVGPGARGEAGGNNVNAAGAVVPTAPVFTPGIPGRGCWFTIKITVATDPNPPHEGFVGYTTIEILDVLVTNKTTITITGVAGGKWIAVTGTFNPATGAFTASGSGVAATIAGVPSTFTGTINFATGQITGQITLTGTATTPPNGLPGHSVSYNVTGNVTGVTPP